MDIDIGVLTFPDIGIDGSYTVFTERKIEIKRTVQKYTYYDYGINYDKHIVNIDLIGKYDVIESLRNTIANISDYNAIYIVLKNFNGDNDFLGPAFVPGEYRAIIRNTVINDNASGNYYRTIGLQLEIIAYRNGTPIAYKTAITDSMPELYYITQPSRELESSTRFNSALIGGGDQYMYTINESNAGNDIRTESATFDVTHCDQNNMTQLQYFYAHGGRFTSFSYTTNKATLFRNNKTNDVRLLSLVMRKASAVYWEATIEMVEA